VLALYKDVTPRPIEGIAVPQSEYQRITKFVFRVLRFRVMGWWGVLCSYLANLHTSRTDQVGETEV
jgi:hypothetical protein